MRLKKRKEDGMLEALTVTFYPVLVWGTVSSGVGLGVTAPTPIDTHYESMNRFGAPTKWKQTV